MRESRIRFIRQQGFDSPITDDFYSALMLQPKIIGVLVAVGVLTQSTWVFLALSAASWWSAVVPTHSLFDATYNHVVAYRRQLAPLGAAPAPRRFATGMVGLVTLAIGASLLSDTTALAWALESLLVVAVIAVVFTDNCAGANVYHALQRGRSPLRT